MAESGLSLAHTACTRCHRGGHTARDSREEDRAASGELLGRTGDERQGNGRLSPRQGLVSHEGERDAYAMRWLSCTS